MSELPRLRWLCRRGMKELDVVMTRYLEQYYESASNDERGYFKSLLKLPDPDLYNLLLGRSELTDPELTRFARALGYISRRN